MFHIGGLLAGLFCKLCHGAIVIQPHHRGEAFGIKVGRIGLSDQRVGVGRVANHQHLHIALGMRVQRLSLRCENRAIGRQQIFAFHARPARTRTDQKRAIHILERDIGIIGRDNPLEQREGAIGQLHHNPVQRFQCGRDFQQVQDDGLIGAQHVARGNAKKQGIADLAGRAGNRNTHGSFHGKNLSGEGSKYRKLVCPQPRPRSRWQRGAFAPQAAGWRQNGLSPWRRAFSSAQS